MQDGAPSSSNRRTHNLRIDTSLIVGKGGSKSIEQEERERRVRRERETRDRVRKEQERIIVLSASGSASSIASGSVSASAPSSETTSPEAMQQQYSDTSHDSQDMDDNEYGDEQEYHDRQQMHPQSGAAHVDPNTHQDRDHNMQQDSDEQYGEDHDGQDGEEGEEEEEEEEEDDDLSSSPSVPDEHIDFDLVYALHTFLATVEGQASVVKGDQLTLLDDSNSYWWLVRVLKTQAVGYIPAENIETPFERLARLNKHRNVDITYATQEDLLTGTGSSLAQTRFAQPHHPTNKSLQTTASRPPVQLNPALAGGGRFVDFAPPIYHEHEGFFHSGSEGTDDGEEEYEEGQSGEEEEEGEEGDEQGSEGSFENTSMEEPHHAVQNVGYGAAPDRGQILTEEEEMDDDRRYHARQAQQIHAQQRSVDDGTDDTVKLSNASRPGLGEQERTMSNEGQRAPLQPLSRTSQAQGQAALGVAGGQRPGVLQPGYIAQAQQQVQQQPALNRKISIDEQLRAEQEAQSQTSPRQALNPPSSLVGGQPLTQIRSTSSTTSSTSSSRRKPFSDAVADGAEAIASAVTVNGETRKISLTPRIVRDDSAESNLSDRALSPTGSNHSSQQQHNNQQQQRQPLRNVSNASSAAGNQSADQSMVSSTISNTGAVRDKMAPTLLEMDEEYIHQRKGSAGSAISASSSSSHGHAGTKRSGATSPANAESSGSAPTPKKKKSSGILGGLFSRNKKDKGDKDKKSKDEGTRKVSGGSSSAASDDDRSSSTSSPAPESPEQRSRQSPQPGAGNNGIVTQQLQQRRAKEQAKDEMFGTTAALRQQQVEAQNAMYHQYGIHPRSPGDTSNTSTFSNNRQPSSASTPTGAPVSSSMASNGSLQPTPMSVSMSSASGQSSLAGSVGPSGQRLRPGSLIGSPLMPGTTANGVDVPVLNVLRVFAGENVVAEATFKTVLLNESTTTEDLVKQAMQRFKLSPPANALNADGVSAIETIMQEYYLTAKEVSGDETLLEVGQKPLQVFENLSQASGFLSPGQGLPSVKRSSVGSINSIASNLSLNPAIEKLRMSDFGDDSVVKFFINKRTPDENAASNTASSKRSSSDSSTSTIGKRRSDDFALDSNRLSATGSILDKGPAPGMPTSPLLRFAIKIIIHPGDLPESMVFDPISTAIIPKSTLSERQQQAASRSPSISSMLNVTSSHREKIIFFPRNANVSEVLETALDRFGIVEGVVDGGDEVEDRLSKRRSMSRVRYCLAMTFEGQRGEETPLSSSSKLLDAYNEPPVFKHYERNSKEFRRRSMDASYSTPSGSDLQSTDPTFVIRRAAFKPSLDRKLSGKVIESQQLRPDLGGRNVSAISNSASTRSLYSTPMSELPPELERAVSPQQTRQEIIAAQRAASRATQQKAMVSAQKNGQQGVDVMLEDRTRIRSSKDSTNTTRYSYVGVDGSELDISEIMEKEWRAGKEENRADSVTPVPARNSPSALSHTTNESFASALASPLSASSSSLNNKLMSDYDAEELKAIENLSSTPVHIDRSKDYLEGALGRRAASPAMSNSSQMTGTSENIHERLDRVLAKVKTGNAAPTGLAGGIASALRSHSSSGVTAARPAETRSGQDSGRSTPSAMSRNGSTSQDRPSYVAQALRARSGSNASAATGGRASPALQVNGRSTPQLDTSPSSSSSTPRRGPTAQGHVKQSSITSVSDTSSSNRTGSPSTPATNANSNLTPISSRRAESSLGRTPVPYSEDFGLEFLMQMVNMDALEPKPRKLPAGHDTLTFHDIPFPDLSPEVAARYEQPRTKLDELDARLDRLLEQAMATH